MKDWRLEKEKSWKSENENPHYLKQATKWNQQMVEIVVQLWNLIGSEVSQKKNETKTK